MTYVALRISKTLDISVVQGWMGIAENDKLWERRVKGDSSIRLKISQAATFVFKPIMAIETELRFGRINREFRSKQ